MAGQRGGAGTRKIKKRANTRRKAGLFPHLCPPPVGAGIAHLANSRANRKTDRPSGGPEKAKRRTASCSLIFSPHFCKKRNWGGQGWCRSGQDRYAEAVARTKIGPRRAFPALTQRAFPATAGKARTRNERAAVAAAKRPECLGWVKKMSLDDLKRKRSKRLVFRIGVI